MSLSDSLKTGGTSSVKIYISNKEASWSTEKYIPKLWWS